MNAQLKPIRYNDGTTKLNGISVTPKNANSKNPGILILPAWKGIDNNTKEAAEALSKLGYHAFIADIYGEGNYPKDATEAGAIAGKYKKDYKSYLNRIDLARKELIKMGANADNLVVIGYCFGGTGAIEAARANFPFKGIVSFHGGLGKEATRAIEMINPKVLICHGADDPFVSEKEILAFQQEMRDNKADWQMIYYANAVHAFTEKEAGNDNSKGAAYNEVAAKRSWQHLLLFLNETMTK
nr:dienelactone hydrolase family protein [Flavobacterium sp. '19STA2R22 D10 B1']